LYRYVRRVQTASGATAVQIVHKRGRRVVGIDHIGSAHDEDRLALLEETARERLHADQQVLDREMPRSGRAGAASMSGAAGAAVVESTSSLLLWNALGGLYEALGLFAVRDEAFRALVLGRIVEPTSKLDTVRVLGELGVDAPSRVTFMRCLKRAVERDCRATISDACFTHATRTGGLAWVLYDVTTLYFEAVLRDPARGRVTQGRDEQGTPGRPAGHRRAADRRGRIPAGRAPVRGQ
jgi:hypothetical protein